MPDDVKREFFLKEFGRFGYESRRANLFIEDLREAYKGLEGVGERLESLAEKSGKEHAIESLVKEAKALRGTKNDAIRKAFVSNAKAASIRDPGKLASQMDTRMLLDYQASLSGTLGFPELESQATLGYAKRSLGSAVQTYKSVWDKAKDLGSRAVKYTAFAAIGLMSFFSPGHVDDNNKNKEMISMVQPKDYKQIRNSNEMPAERVRPARALEIKPIQTPIEPVSKPAPQKAHKPSTLPLPKGSYMEGPKKGYSVILPVREFRKSKTGNYSFRFMQDGDFDSIGVKTAAGWFTGLPGQPISVEITEGEYRSYVRGKDVSFQVKGIKKIGGKDEMAASYRNGYLRN